MADYIPPKDSELVQWLNNYKSRIPVVGPGVGLSAPTLTSTDTMITAYLSTFAGLLAARNTLKVNTASTRTAETALLAFLRAQVKQIKAATAYTTAIGEDLRVIGEGEAFDPDTFKPTFTTTVLPGEVKLEFVKGPTSGVNIYCRLKGQSVWKFVARDTNSPYDDYTPLANAGVAEMREYAIRAVLTDAEIGLLSDIVAATFAG